MQIDLVPEKFPSGGSENTVTVMDVFATYSFAYPNSSQDAKTFGRVMFNIMTKQAYLSNAIISDNGSAFVSHINKEVTNVLGFMIQHAETEHAQTIGMLE